ncbi:hypothetical protein AAHN97_21415 [Chitinophaga niabensis]|uniref:hypothetical protein n=1 Tax=Chitinophaga niabensis TaxID=536979 RepID=UPI0031BA714E
MSFNIIAETTRSLNYTEVHAAIHSPDLNFDLVPMPGLGINKGDAMGICIPMNNANESTWEQLKPVLKILRIKFGCEVYDLYGGQKLGLFNMKTFKQNLIG